MLHKNKACNNTHLKKKQVGLDAEIMEVLNLDAAGGVDDTQGHRQPGQEVFDFAGFIIISRAEQLGKQVRVAEQLVRNIT